MLFIDTASFSEAKKWVQQYCVCRGVTSNPKIFSNEQGIDFKQRVKDLLSLDVPVSVELVSQNCSVYDLVEEALNYRKDFKSKNLVIKIPMWKDNSGLEVAKKLVENNIEVNITCLMNMNQVILACGVGATYASLFYRRMVDYNKASDFTVQPEVKTLDTIQKCRNFINHQGFKTEIICGSIREPTDVSNCLTAGAHIVTVTPNILEQLSFHQKTEEVIEEFDKAWNQWSCKK
jgi:transaldolase